MAELQIEQVSKIYQKGQGYVLKSVNLTVHSGEMFFLLGPSGCGKSTLLRLIAGLLEPTEGKIILDGRDITALPPEKRNTPMVFQSYALWPHMDVFENIAFGLRQMRLSGNEIKRRVESILRAVRMEDFIHRKVTGLSGGQQQRIALARALALNPSIILLDEPLSNLDAKLRDSMRLEIRRICKERSLTAVYVTHDRKEALSMADRLAVLNEGNIQQIGTPREIYTHPSCRFTASFLGDANFLPGKVIRADGDFVFFSTECGEFAARRQPETEYAAGSEYSLMFRPETMKIGAAAETMNRFSARILENSYLGESSFRTMESGSFRFYLNEYAAEERAAGTEQAVSVPPDHVIPLNR